MQNLATIPFTAAKLLFLTVTTFLGMALNLLCSATYPQNEQHFQIIGVHLKQNFRSRKSVLDLYKYH